LNPEYVAMATMRLSLAPKEFSEAAA
jgi:hypothetical protein